MTVSPTTYSAFATSARSYLKHLQGCFSDNNLATIELLAEALRQAWIDGRHVYICGNGGSAANAIHIANDFLYGSGGCGPGPQLTGIRVEALPANSGVITCLANDTGYDNIYAHQLKVKGRKGDLLIVLSGSGKSPNIVRALETAKSMGINSFAILAFDGGPSKKLADNTIYFQTDDMQIAEDTQLIVGHLCMQWLNTHKPPHLKPLF